MNLLILLGMKKQLNLLKRNKLSILYKNRGGFILPLFVVFLLFINCGIDVPYYLNPPTYTGVNLSFYNAYINDPNYAQGYDFFYRIYDNNILNNTTVINEANSFFSDSTLLGLLSNDRVLFKNSFYRRILPVSNDISTDYKISHEPIPIAKTPIMRVDPDYFDKSDSSKSFEVSFNLNLLNPSDAQISTTGYNPSGSYPSEIYFKRYVTIDEIIFVDLPFSQIDQNHDDVPVLSDTTISIAFFVVLYGLTDQFMSIFSDVIYIGSEVYTF